MSGLLKRGLLYVMGALMLAACGGSGGGGDDGGGGTTPTPAVAVSLKIYDANGSETSNVTPSSPGTVKATVTNNGAAVPNAVVTFTSTIGVLDPISGTALTNAQGVAQITLKAGSSPGAGTVSGSATIGSVTATGTANFSTSIPANNVTLTVSGPAAPLSAGATTSIVATLANSDGSAFNEVVPVSFTSGCVTNGKAVINSPVSTIAGVATSTYRAAGCVGQDVVSVSASVGGTVLTRTLVVTVQPAALGSIEFVSATPQNIALKGTGDGVRPESSVVKFRVLDAQGNPVNGQEVNFSLNTTVGGIKVEPSRANSDLNGVMQTTVTAGAVATSVRVTATIVTNGNTLTAQSSNLVITTGLADQDSVSLSASVLNPEAWEIDGQEVTITARLADAFNNPVPDGTTVQFQAEGGSIGGDCKTANGVCSVKWISQNPRPAGTGAPGCVGVPSLVTGKCGQPYGGRVTVLATAIGNESFVDLNGNGLFDADNDSEVNAFRTGKDNSGDWFDLPEAFVDHNEDGTYRGGVTGSTNETFLDFNSNGVWDLKNDKYNGVLCAVGGAIVGEGVSGNCGSRTLHVRDSLTLVMSSNGVYGRFQQTCTSDTPAFTPLTVGMEATASACLVFSDFHNQPIPADTRISISTSVGSVVGPSTYTMPSTAENSARAVGFAVKGGTKPESGLLTITFTTPSGLVSVFQLPVVVQ